MLWPLLTDSRPLNLALLPTYSATAKWRNGGRSPASGSINNFLDGFFP
jgi:hypothetical protein